MASHLASYGLYPSMSALFTGAEALKAAGFRQTDISVLYPDRVGTREFTHDSPPDSAAVGAATGAAFGGLLAYLAGIGAITFPGIGPFIAAGPLASTLAGIGAGVAAGGLLGSLVGLGLPPSAAERYERLLRQGGLLMSVHCDDEECAGTAKRILYQTGAEHVETAPEMAADYQS